MCGGGLCGQTASLSRAISNTSRDSEFPQPVSQTRQPVEKVACNSEASLRSTLRATQKTEIGALRAIWPAFSGREQASEAFFNRLEGL
jgi:hypothetical protein